MDIESTVEPHEELDEILNGTTPEDLNAEPEPVAPEPVTAEVPEKGDDKEVPPASDSGDKAREEQGRAAAIVAERQRRQQAEARLAALEQQLAQQQAQRRAEEPALDPFGDPNAFQQALARTVADAARSASIEALSQRDMERSEAALYERLGHDKFHESVAEFELMVRADPTLAVQMQKAPDPGMFLEKTVEKRRKMADYQNDPDGFEARLRAKWEREQAEKATVQETNAAAAKPRPPLPRTIANTGGAAPSAGEIPQTSLAALLGET